MWKNYLKTALRNLRKTPGYSLINVTGLTLGLTCCLLIFKYVTFEYSFDDFHDNEENLYRVLQATPLQSDSFEPGGAFTPQALAPALKEEVPEIRRITRVHPEYSGAVVASQARPERVFEEEEALYVDPAFLKMFTFPLSSGSVEGALQPGTILLSKSAARKYFGHENVSGKVLDWTGATDRNYRVTGVFEDVPANSHLQFEFLLPMDDLLQNEQYRNEPEGGWSWNNLLTYIQLHSKADRHAVDQKMTDVYMGRRGEWLEEHGRKVRLWTQPLEDIHLNADILAPAGVIGSYRTVYFFTVVGLVTLAIALLNYVNLATARSLDRAGEIGVRKAVGAGRGQLIGQYLFESALANVIAAGLAVALAVLLRPLVNDLAGTQLTGAMWTDPWFWSIFIAIFGVSILGAGLYPAFVLSSFDPVAVMRGKASFSSFGGSISLRKGLVIFQFAASFVLLAGTVVVYNQLHYMRNMDLELNLEKVLTVEGPRVLPEGRSPQKALATFTRELRRLPSVRQVATSASLPGQGFNWNGADVRKATDDPASVIRGVITYIDTSFADLYGLNLLAGKGFTEATMSGGENRPMQLLANETAIENLGFSSSREAVGQRLAVGGGNDAQIIGVVRDFNWTSAHEARKNIFLGYAESGRHVSVRLSTDDLSSAISAIEEIYRSLFPGNPFSYSFVDQQFDQQYRSDQRFARLFTGFAGLAILIACLGLFGLASYTAKKRKKEIGIRKVLGATTANIAASLSGRFLKLVLVGILVAMPIAYFGAQRWLENFFYRIELGPWMFIGAGSLALLIALVAVSYQSIQAALTNPADSIRYE